MSNLDTVTLRCNGCNKAPAELGEYVEAAKQCDMTPNQYVWEEEGTLNTNNGHFLCTVCYVEAGMPSALDGWTAP